MPAVAAVTCACVVVIAGKALTVTVMLAVAVGVFTDVAVIVALPVEPVALNVADVVETAASVVHAAPEQAQVAPALLESFATVAARTTCCPRSIDWAALGLSETLVLGAEALQPENTNTATIAIISDTFFIRFLRPKKYENRS